MSFALGEVKFCRNKERRAICPLLRKGKTDNNDDQIKKIYAREEKIRKFQNNTHKIILKIGQIFIDNV